MLSLLGARPSALTEAPPSDDDWYLNLLWIERRKCLPLTHVRTLFPIFVADVRKADVTPIGQYVTALIKEELRSKSFAPNTLDPLDPGDVQLARTQSRSVLAVMNNTALLVRYQVAAMGGIDYAYATVVNHFLRRTPHQREGGWITPDDLVGTEALRPRHRGLTAPALRT